MNLASLATLIASKKGRIAAQIASLTVGALTQLATSKGLEMNGELATAISGLVTFLTAYLIETLAARMLNVSMGQIQEALPGIVATGGAQPDGKTVNAVKSLVAATDGPGSVDPVPPMSLVEAQELKAMIHPVMQENPALLNAFRQTVATINKSA